ncbi:MAG: methyltransferase [Verrucomicrobia bacterium]|nr:MAG: methyltransferase [Verrucomicrobiota bacterium]
MPLHELTLVPHTDPIEIYRLRDGFYATDLLGAAIVGLDFFTWLAEHPSDKATICRELQIRERPTDVMLTLFKALGFVEAKEGIFCVTQLASEHLVKSSPWYLGPYYEALKDRPVCQDYVRVLKTGQTANWGSFKDEKDWARAMEEEGFAQQFTAAMDCRGVYLGPAVARNLDCRGLTRLLDIGGGSGIYACALVATHGQLAATVFEKPPVDQVARQAIADRGFAGRVAVQAGDMFAQELPADYDLHLLSNVLHDWDEPVARRILAKSFRALKPGGMLVVHDAHLNENKSGPLPVAKYSALLMHSTEGKCYSLAEMQNYLAEAGFSGMRFQETAADRSIITARKP